MTEAPPNASSSSCPSADARLYRVSPVRWRPFREHRLLDHREEVGRFHRRRGRVVAQSPPRPPRRQVHHNQPVGAPGGQCHVRHEPIVRHHGVVGQVHADQLLTAASGLMNIGAPVSSTHNRSAGSTTMLYRQQRRCVVVGAGVFQARFGKKTAALTRRSATVNATSSPHFGKLTNTRPDVDTLTPVGIGPSSNVCTVSDRPIVWSQVFRHGRRLPGPTRP
jgi:hypothetical protein